MNVLRSYLESRQPRCPQRRERLGALAACIDHEPIRCGMTVLMLDELRRVRHWPTSLVLEMLTDLQARACLSHAVIHTGEVYGLVAVVWPDREWLTIDLATLAEACAMAAPKPHTRQLKEVA